MPKILIVDSNTPELNAKSDVPVGAEYAAALTSIRADVTCDILSPYAGEQVPDLKGYDGAAFTGSGVAWNTDDARAEPVAAAMRAVFAASIPSVGSCNGLQLAATVLGGSSDESPNGREDGLAKDIRLTDAGRDHPFLTGRRDGYAVPCVHRDQVVRLPDGAIVLARNAHSPVQAMAYEQDGIRFWGVQYHPELSPAVLASILDNRNHVAPDVVADLHVAAEDEGAAARLGTTCADQQPEGRMIELRNWLGSL